MALFRKKSPPGEISHRRIADPQAHAALSDPGPFQVVEQCSLWESWAVHYTTTRDFGQVGGIAYHNNCGPTALTNLLCMAANCRPARDGREQDPQALYDRVARYGIRHLYFINSAHRLFHGSSDLRAGSWIRRMFRQVLGFRPRVRFHFLTLGALRKTFQSGNLAYLMLWGHPVYRSHHLLGYGYLRLRSQSTGRIKTYIQVSDGHVQAPRYLELEGTRGAFYAVEAR